MTAQRWAYLILIIGIVLRLLRYFSNPVVWSDDALRLFEVQKYSYFQLFQLERVYPSIVHDAYGFLVIQKFLISLLGTSAYVFRLVPFLSSLLGLVLFYRIKDWFVSPTGGLLALGLFALCPPIINYTAIFNTYPSDIGLALLVYMALRHLEKHDLKWSEVVGFSLLGSLCSWLSLQSVFVLGGGMGALLIAQVARKNFGKALKLVVMAGFWMANFAFYYFHTLRYHVTKAGLLESWQENLAPSTQGISVVALWFVKKFYAMFANPAGVMPALAVSLFFIGCIILWHRRKTQLCVLLFPIALTALASGLHKYAFADRALIFLIPALYLLIGEGWAWLYRREVLTYKPILTGAIVAALIYTPLIRTADISALSFQRTGVKEVLDFIDQHYCMGDIVYVYYNAQMTFLYYKDASGLKRKEYLLGSLCRKQMKCRGDIELLKKYQRVWFLFFMTGDTDEIKFWKCSLEEWARMRRSFRTQWAGTYLFEKKKIMKPF